MMITIITQFLRIVLARDITFNLPLAAKCNVVIVNEI